MMASTRRLSDVARYVRIPDGIVSTGWPAVAAKCREWGVRFEGGDAWQGGLGRLCLGKRASGKYAATVGGITFWIPRQVAKTFFVGRLIFALCVLFPGLQVVWTAHHGATLTKTFQSLSAFARRKKVAPYIGDPTNGSSGIRRGSNQQAILFLNGSTIWFGSRGEGFGRGFEEIDILVFDEAQILNPLALDDLIAAANQSQHQHGALIFYMGTPPRPTDRGDTFLKRRADALEGLSPGATSGQLIGGDAVYVETSADPDIGQDGGPSLDDREQWRKANPSYPDRTPEESMLRMRANLPSDDSWRREAMGVPDQVAIGAGVDLAKFPTLVLPVDEYFTADVFAVDIAPERTSACIVVAGRAGNRFAMEIPSVDGIADHRPGTQWLKPRIRELVKAFPDAVWAIVNRSQASTLIKFLTEELEAIVEEIAVADWPAACSSMVDLIGSRQVLHLGDEDLVDAFAGAVLVNVGEEQFRWGRRKSSIDITPVIAATAAVRIVSLEAMTEYDVMASLGM